MSINSSGPEDVKEHLNFIEELIAGASSSDEYLEAIVRNQQLMIALMEGGGGSVPEIGSVGVPEDTAGIAIQSASKGDLAEFLYKNNGRTIVSKLESSSDIQGGEVVTVNSDGDLEPSSGVSQGDLDFGNISTSAKGPGDLVYGDTQNDVSIDPGDSETVLEVNLNDGGAWYSAGTNDETYSLYQYHVDGEPLLEDPIPKPLGLYNNMFEFPEPIEVQNSVSVEVTRQSDAPGSAKYFSNIVVM